MLKKLLFLTCGILLIASTACAQIVVESERSRAFGAGANTVNQNSYTLSEFEAGTNTKLVVCFAIEGGNPANFGVTFGGVPLTEIQASSDASDNENTSIYFLDGASGTADIVVTTGGGNGAGIFAEALSGAAPGFETSGALGDGQAIFGDLTGTLTDVSDGAYVTSIFIDQNQAGEILVTGLERDSAFLGGNFNAIGSAVALAATGFGNGSDIALTFNDLANSSQNGEFNNRSNASYASFAVAEDSGTLVGDVNLDGSVNFSDITPFIRVLSANRFQAEADIDGNGSVDFSDITPFIAILSGG